VRHAGTILAIGFCSLVCLCLSNLNEFFTIARSGVPRSKSGEKAVVYQNPVRGAEISAAAFESILPVLRHPRCMNCHSSGDFPRQGDDRHPHSMHIRRGPDGSQYSEMQYLPSGPQPCRSTHASGSPGLAFAFS
jgi:hypothetical protein